MSDSTRAAVSQKPWIVQIPETKKLERPEENLGAVDIELSATQVAALGDASSTVKMEGARYSEFHQKLVGR